VGDFQIPAANGKRTFNIDTAKNVHAINLYWTIAGVAATYAEMIAQVSRVIVKVAGKDKYDLTGTQCLDLDRYHKLANGAFTEAGQMSISLVPQIPLDGKTLKAYAYGMLSDKDRSRRNTLVLEITMGAAVTVDQCEVELVYDDEPADVIGYHVVTKRFGTTWAAASRHRIDGIALESNALAVLAYHVHHPAAGTLTRVGLNVNDSDVISDRPLGLILKDLHDAGRTKVANYEPIDFTLSNHPTAFLDVSRLVNQYLDLTWSVAPTTYELIIPQLCFGV
jgi:hypothetical protein